MTLAEISLAIVTNSVDLILVVKNQSMGSSTCCLFDLIVETWKECEFVNLIVFTLHSELSLSVISCYKDCSLLRNDYSPVFSATDTFHNHICCV